MSVAGIAVPGSKRARVAPAAAAAAAAAAAPAVVFVVHSCRVPFKTGSDFAHDARLPDSRDTKCIGVFASAASANRCAVDLYKDLKGIDESQSADSDSGGDGDEDADDSDDESFAPYVGVDGLVDCGDNGDEGDGGCDDDYTTPRVWVERWVVSMY